MFKQKRFILKVLLYTIGLTSIFGLDKAWGMSWLGEKKIEAPLDRKRVVYGNRGGVGVGGCGV